MLVCRTLIQCVLSLLLAEPLTLLAAEPATPAAPQPPAQLRLISLAGRNVEVQVDNPGNPLVLMQTSAGDIVLELFTQEAPETVANFLGLANGTKTFTDAITGMEIMQPFYDNLVFHRVISGFMIQGGSQTGAGDGSPGYHFGDEISAVSLGLDKMLVLDGSGVPNAVLGIRSQADFQQRVLGPLYRSMNITSQQQLDVRIAEVDQHLRELSVQQNLEMLGYHFHNELQSHAPVKGVIAMANSGPDSNGSQFFITLADTPWLTGKHTVFGKVRAGLDVVDMIGKVKVDETSRPLQAVTINSVRSL
jgi:cyclophilin family peptidyl-prolyl cis-trans isomerase